MTQDYAAKALVALDGFAPHPSLEDEKRRIVDRTLKRIEQATMLREMDELLKLRNA